MSCCTYVSTIAADIDISEVGRIARNARVNNSTNAITGLLVFDGERFAQQLEGHSRSVRKLFERIASDPRHADVHVLHQGASTERKFHRFSMGYANLDELESLRCLDLQRGQKAVTTFVELVPRIDMEP